MTTDRFEDGVQWWMDTTKPMSMALYPNPPQWHIDTGNLVRLVPQRPWVGLTNEEIDGMVEVTDLSGAYYYDDLLALARAIEAKLKEKNT